VVENRAVLHGLVLAVGDFLRSRAAAQGRVPALAFALRHFSFRPPEWIARNNYQGVLPASWRHARAPRSP
jgi:hypothetical protein